MSTRDEIIERAARAGFCNVDGDAKAAGVLWDSGDPIYCQDGWRDDIAAALDALTIEDLLTLAGLVGPTDCVPIDAHTMAVILIDAASLIEVMAERSALVDQEKAELVIPLNEMACVIQRRLAREAGR